MLPFFERTPRCLVGIEACGTSHHWARELFALGHEVRQIPPAYVKPYVTRGKTDAADAEVICEAVTRPTMRFVSVKSRDQQAALSMHRARNLLVKQWTQLVNMMRGRLAEFGINIPQGLERALMMARQIVDGAAPDVAPEAVKIIGTLSQQALDVHVRLREIDCDLLVWQRSSEVARRRMTIPGIGPVGATVFAATVVDASQFRSGRQFAAWLGLPRCRSRAVARSGLVGSPRLETSICYKPETVDPQLADSAKAAVTPTKTTISSNANSPTSVR